MPPTVFPTGTTIYKPDKCWNGYTIYPTITETGAVLIDMNGNVVKSWPHYQSFPLLLLPEGQILGGQVGRVTRTYDHELGSDDVVQEDWDGNVVWKFGEADQIEVDGQSLWSARQNHDNVREGCPVGYYVPDLTPKSREAKTLILSQKSGRWPQITQDYLPRAARIIEVDWDGNTLITESNYGRLIEVTEDCETVWEYISPYSVSTTVFSSDIFRAYRYPYEWVPQLDTPVQRAVIPPDNSEFRIDPTRGLPAFL